MPVSGVKVLQRLDEPLPVVARSSSTKGNAIGSHRSRAGSLLWHKPAPVEAYADPVNLDQSKELDTQEPELRMQSG
jgi:hypothetical protein